MKVTERDWGNTGLKALLLFLTLRMLMALALCGSAIKEPYR